ncbi:hypothetical protein SAMN02799624_05392 [Paenibacillus sp. UNC496MF]|uniref:hypothetical protein n=1 Tax=Paenibacillus sp. UNC496MF TaxID=1502753 RepID=UPI0008EF9785|nr:hypothetical protein [Paenibacillus sp. UNC496MF]SFJ65325.1 hypothetical protein SAMN02799624_05392 [Paenibacillus sp. UNC496MF]
MQNILLGADNPQGEKLEEVLAQLQFEILGKTKKIVRDDSEPAAQVKRNNYEILRLLNQAEELQRMSMALLEKVGPNQGPTGAPRIGVQHIGD